MFRLPRYVLRGRWRLQVWRMPSLMAQSIALIVKSRILNFINNLYEVEINHQEIVKAKHVINAAGLNTEKNWPHA